MIDKERILDVLDDFKDEYGTSFSSAYAEETDIIENALELYYEKLKEEKAICNTYTEKCHNENHDYAECDQFVCSNCGIELQDWHRVERDEDDGDVTYHEYEFNYCPNCGAKIGKDVLTTMISKK